MGGGLESRCVGRVYGADGAVARHHPQVGISNYFMRKMRGQTTLKFTRFIPFPEIKECSSHRPTLF